MTWASWPPTFCPKELFKALDKARKINLQFNSNLLKYVSLKCVFLGKKYVTHETHGAMRTMLKFYNKLYMLLNLVL
jgi:hypothetical protein